MGDESEMGAPLVAVLTGSPSDLEVVNVASEVLEHLDIPSELKVLSALRTPDRVLRYIAQAEAAGVEVFIACADRAAHLAGLVASHTLKPVIGVPLNSGQMGGLDALLSTVQMPAGIPVAAVGVDGARNAAYLAARILATKDPSILLRLQADEQQQREHYDSVDDLAP